MVTTTQFGARDRSVTDGGHGPDGVGHAAPDGSISGGAVEPGWRSRANAAFFSAIDRYAAYVSDWHKRVAFAGLTASSIVEIGPGVGANFAWYPRGATVWAIEPNPAMHRRLTERADEAGVDLRIVPTGAANLPFEDASVDCVVSTLVLCTVDDPAAALAEVVRVLRPGGTFRFVEHIAARPRGVRALLQRALRRPWAWAFEGCDLLRHTDHLIRTAGFDVVDLHHRRLRRSVFVPVNSVVAGIGRAAAPRPDPPAATVDPCGRPDRGASRP